MGSSRAHLINVQKIARYSNHRTWNASRWDNCADAVPHGGADCANIIPDKLVTDDEDEDESIIYKDTTPAQKIAKEEIAKQAAV